MKCTLQSRPDRAGNVAAWPANRYPRLAPLVSLVVLFLLTIPFADIAAQSRPTPVPTNAAALGIQPIATPSGLPAAEMFVRTHHSPAVNFADVGSLRWRMGVGVPSIGPLPFLWPEARPGWFLSWSINMVEGGVPFPDPATIDMDAPDYRRLGMEFVPLVKMLDGQLYFSASTLTTAAAHNPGRTWIIGNEPDNAWQDNTTALDYARAYHDAYHAIKQGDPTAQIAIAGLSQITPLRLTYLNRVWSTYERLYAATMPVDVWTMHAYVLREEAGNWGVGIPPGFESITTGILWDVEDHGDLRLVENQVRLMRSWMDRHDQEDKPLWITEYGILLPGVFGYDEARIQSFMIESFELFRKLSHPRLGLRSDAGHLVQRWSWFSTYYEPFPNSDLFDADGLPKPLMELYSIYLSETGDAQAAE